VPEKISVPLPTFQNSYLITARSQPCYSYSANIVPLPNGNLWFYSAPAMYDADACDYKPAGPAAAAPPSSFLTNLTSDLERAIQAGFPQLTVVVHGLGNLFTDSVAEMSTVGSGLQQWGNYGGLVISFDWPSYDMLDSATYYASLPYCFPPKKTSGTIRDNINGTVPGFANLITMLQGIRSRYPEVQVNFICHSEGNYMMMLAMSEQLQSQSPLVSQTLLVAADINNGALQSAGSLPDTGQGMAISKLSDRVAVYYSSGDDVLPHSEYWFSPYHDPSYSQRLGLEGPYSYDTSSTPLASNTYGVDCSAVINDTVIKKIPQVPPGTSSHASYFYVPQVLLDWAQTLIGTAPGQVVNREANAKAKDGQGYIMQFVSPPANRLIRGSVRRRAA
jgi:esterase/lipase superfamily enzyme